ncbi:hypothetical protein HDU67_002113, partial [Dinochytrium kinnereticum]
MTLRRLSETLLDPSPAQPATGPRSLQIRLGVHTGAAIGFVSGGTSMIKYELGGEVVDGVERVQEVALPGCVYVSGSTRALLDPFRVKVEAVEGGVGGMEVWWLKECQFPKDFGERKE